MTKNLDNLTEDIRQLISNLLIDNIDSNSFSEEDSFLYLKLKYLFDLYNECVDMLKSNNLHSVRIVVRTMMETSFSISAAVESSKSMTELRLSELKEELNCLLKYPDTSSISKGLSNINSEISRLETSGSITTHKNWNRFECSKTIDQSESLYRGNYHLISGYCHAQTSTLMNYKLTPLLVFWQSMLFSVIISVYKSLKKLNLKSNDPNKYVKQCADLLHRLVDVVQYYETHPNDLK